VLVGERFINVTQPDGKVITQLFADYDNIGVQNGGWSMHWQGVEGN
jgi:beta-glucosidase